ncbi:MAG: DNA primase [Clostridiales bacterium]|nr:DNA primase [Clostridiales bacterium]
MAGGFPSEFLEELKLRNNIVDVLSGYIQLQKKGGRYFACCPFHHEKTPSFCVNEHSGYYHCFGCGVSGDVIRFVMEFESLDFYDAVKLLASRAGMTLPALENTGEQKQKKERNERLLKMMYEACSYYFKMLRQPEKGREARDYLNSRGITDEISKRYALGLSYDSSGLRNYLLERGYSDRDMEECGLTSDRKDSLSERIIVPIRDAMGKVVAFGGRVYKKGDERPKYKNTANTVLFDKGRTLFGANYIKDLKLSGGVKEIILVEGYMDVIALGSKGVLNAVAAMGTALTPTQARAIKRLCSSVVLSYDGDEAGKKAALRNAQILVQEGAEVKVAALPEGMDPDDVIKNYGKEEYLKFIGEAKPVPLYRLDTLESKFNLATVDGRAKYASAAVEVLRDIPDPLEREVYAALVSEKSKAGVDSLLKQAAEVKEQKQEEIVQPPIQSKEDAAKYIAARAVLKSMLEGRNIVSIKDIDEKWLPDETQKKVYRFIAERLSQGKEPKIAFIYDEIEENAELSEIIKFEEKFVSPAAEEKYLKDCAFLLANEYLSDYSKALVQSYETESDENKKKEIIKKITIIQKKLRSESLTDKR